MLLISIFFFFNDTATTEIYTLSLHDALPISLYSRVSAIVYFACLYRFQLSTAAAMSASCRRLLRSEEHTSELQSRSDLVCRLLLEKKKKILQISALSSTVRIIMYRLLMLMIL